MVKYKTAAAKEIARGWAPTGVFPFFHLSREIRDMIYYYAIGTELRTFKVEDMPVFAACEINTPKLDSTNAGYEEEDLGLIWDTWYTCGYCSAANGLPQWFLTGKQLCSEALACFGATQTFLTFDCCYLVDYQDSDIWFEKPSSANPLVMDKNVIRHVAVGRDTLGDEEFLAFLRRLEVKDLTLELEWIEHTFFGGFVWERDWKEYIEQWITGDYGCWEGKLRKVKIPIPSSRKEIDDPAPETENVDLAWKLARKLAMKLFGPGANLVWGGLEFESRQYGNGVYVRSVTVEKAG